MEEYMTRRGSCSFGSRKLIMEGGISRYLSNMVEGFWEKGDTHSKIFMAFSVAVISYMTTFAAVWFYFAGWQVQRLMIGLLLLSSATVFVYHRMKGVSKRKSIEYDEIDSVKFVEGRKGLSNPRFLINFTEDGEKRMRYLIMPNRLMPGIEEEIEQVRKEFEDRDIEIES